MNEKKYSVLIKNFSLFVLGTLAPKIIVFFLIPLYTRKLTSHEYGTIELLKTTIQLLLPVFTLTIQDAVMRFSFDTSFDKKHIFSGAVWIIFSGTSLILVLSFLLKATGIVNVPHLYIVYLIILFCLGGLSAIINRFCKGINRVKTLVTAGIIHPVISVIGNVVFLWFMHLGINGYFLAEILGSIFSILYCFFDAKLYKYITFRISKSVVWQMIKFSFPMIFSALAWWVNNASDRYILSWFAGVSVSGIYSLSSKIPSMVAQAQNVFQNAWSISAIKDFDKNDSDGFMGNVFILLTFVMSAVCSIIMLLNIPIAKILYSGEFFEAWHYVPTLLLSVLFNGISLFLDGIFLAAKGTKLISVSTIIGAVVNTCLNLFLIPTIGAYGAAFATMLGYGIGLLFRLMAAKKYIIIKYNRKKIAAGYVFLLAQMVCSFLGAKLWLVQCVFLAGIVVLYKKEWGSVVSPFLKKIPLKSKR